MKDKQFVIAALLLAVGLYMIRCTFAEGPMARFLNMIKVPKLEKRIEHIMPRLKNNANPSGGLDNLKGDDTISGDSPPIPGPTAASSAGDTFGKRMESKMAMMNPMVSSGGCSSFLMNYLKNKMRSV